MSDVYRFKLTGKTPLLMHADDVEAADNLKEWRSAPENKNRSVAGDDRSPPWTWQTYLYSDGEHLAWPQTNIMVGLRQAGAQLILKKQKTFKEISQTGLLIQEEFLEFYCRGEKVPLSAITDLYDMSFPDQKKGAEKLGFNLYTIRAKVGTAKHVRVRPRFNQWEIHGEIHVLLPEITSDILRTLFALAGRGGQGDWRPACKTPGPWGQFIAELE